MREGHKQAGLWHGQVLYTYAEGPRTGKQDLETWKDGEMVESKKVYADKDKAALMIEGWEDLKKLEDLTK